MVFSMLTRLLVVLKIRGRFEAACDVDWLDRGAQNF
jgi:hypothetical protein